MRSPFAGRILLAADAAHICDPFAGLGLLSGLADVGGLAECLEGISRGLVDPSTLDKYGTERRRIWHDVVDSGGSGHFLRVSQRDPETALASDPFLGAVEDLRKEGLGSERPKIQDQVGFFRMFAFA